MIHNSRTIVGVVALLMILFCSASLVFGAETPPGFGAGLFTQLGLDARAASLGGASVAAPDGPSSAYFNPASLASVTNLSFGGMYSNPYGQDFGVTYQYISILGPFGIQSPSSLGIGLTWMNSRIDDIPLWDDEGLVGVTTSHANVYIASVGFSLPTPFEFSIGASARMYSSKLLEGRGDGIGLDVGFLTVFPIGSGQLSLGLNSMDTGNTIIRWKSFSGETRNITPWTIKTGVAYCLHEIGLLVTADCDIEVTRPLEESKLHAGIEYQPISPLLLRAGMEKGFDSKPRFSAGFGINIGKMITLDYAFIPGITFSNTHLFTASFSIRG